jgi:hypothetical protein
MAAFATASLVKLEFSILHWLKRLLCLEEICVTVFIMRYSGENWSVRYQGQRSFFATIIVELNGDLEINRETVSSCLIIWTGSSS